MKITQTLKQKISSYLVKILTPKAIVIDKTILYDRYIDLTIKLPHKKIWVAGDKVQFLISSGELRSYTPYTFLEDHRTFKTLVYDNQLGDGANYLRAITPLERLKILGPRSSLNSNQMKNDVLFFADESSIGLAFSLKDKIKTFIFECHHLESFKALVEEKFKLTNCYYFQREENFNHLNRISALILSDIYPEVYLSGQKESSLQLNQLLTNSGLNNSKIKKKLYWGLTTRRSSRKNAANS